MKQPHIQLEDSLGIRYALLPGDPGRVERIGRYLESVEELGFHREYCSLRGKYKGTDVLVMSTGMGGTSTAIGIEELKRIGVTHMIRIGSCGALQENIRRGELILASGAVRQDGASRAYVEECFPAVPDLELMNACVEAAKRLGYAHHVGLVRSHESFYLDDFHELCEKWSRLGVLGSDQETAAVLTVGRLRAMRAACILNVVSPWKEDFTEGIGAYAGGENAVAEGEKHEILTALEAIAYLNGREG